MTGWEIPVFGLACGTLGWLLREQFAAWRARRAFRALDRIDREAQAMAEADMVAADIAELIRETQRTGDS